MDLGTLLSDPNYNQPSSAPPGQQTPARNDPAFEQNKQGWLSALQDMAKDPESAMMLMQFGTALANPAQGANFGQQVGGAFSEAMQYQGRLQALKEVQALQEQKQGREDRRVDMEERRAELAAQDLQRRIAADEQTASYQNESLKNDRIRANAAMVQARKATSATGAKQAMLDELAGSIQAEYGITPEQARSEAARQMALWSKKDYVNKMLELEQKSFASQAGMPRFPDDPVPQAPNWEDRRAHYAKMFDDDVRGRYDTRDAPAKALDAAKVKVQAWNNLPQSKKDQAVSHFRSLSEAEKADFLTALENRYGLIPPEFDF